MNAPVKIMADQQDERFLTEVELLGAIISQKTSAGYHAAAAIIGPEHFSDNFNARLFARISEGIGQGLQGFPLSAWLISAFRDDDTLTEAKWPASAMVARYVSMACPEIGIEGWARQIRHDRLKVNLNNAVEDGDTAAAEAIAAEMERLSKAHLQRDGGIEQLGDITGRVIDAISEAYRVGKVVEDFAQSGSAEISRWLGGWRRGRFYVIAGRPGMGKSTFAVSMMLKTAAKGHGVMFLALEMGRDELAAMAIADIAWSSERRIEYRDITPSGAIKPAFEHNYQAVFDSAKRLSALPLHIGDKGGLTIAEIRTQALAYKERLAAAGKRLDVICIDHMGLIKPSSSYSGNRVAETEEISAALKVLAKDLQCAVIALAQLNRGVEARDEKRPGLSDLRWSGGIEQDADAVMFVYREAYYLERAKHDDIEKEERREHRLTQVRNKLEVAIAKNRQGPCAVMDFYCDMGCAVVRDGDF